MTDCPPKNYNGKRSASKAVQFIARMQSEYDFRIIVTDS